MLLAQVSRPVFQTGAHVMVTKSVERFAMTTLRMVSCSKVFVVLGLLVAASLSSVAGEVDKHGVLEQSTETEMGGMSRKSFPPNFLFGTGSSAFQYEGAASEGGRGPSIWDTHTHLPGTVSDNSTADVAVDQYHRYKEDVQLMKDLNMDVYRMSISWSRIFPDGVGPDPNWEGVAYYNAVLDELLHQGIQPFVALFHWDLPQALNDSIGGWSNRKMINYFARYADFCFAQFGNRVKHWITFNEPFGHLAYGFEANAECGFNCSSEKDANWTSFRYTEGHHLLLSHAAAAKLYHDKYQEEQGGLLGVAFDANLFWPLSNKAEDIAAAERARLFEMGWMMDPMILGDYPEVMKQSLGARLPQFTEEERQVLRGSLDYVGVNHYTTYYVTKAQDSYKGSSTLFMDPAADITMSVVKDGVQIGPQAASFWLYIVPWGMQNVLNWVRTRYNNPVIFITEHGVDDELIGPAVLQDVLQDEFRIEVHREYLKYVLAAIKDGCDVRGYFVWSLMDNFEWASGFSFRFGLYYVDIADGLKRYPKASARWFQNLLQREPQDTFSKY